MRVVHPAQGHGPSVKPWKSPMIESNGDYRDEQFLEDYIGGPLYENQRHMPRLPVPTISDTLRRFLPTALPLARTEEERMQLIRDCEEFPEQAKLLQERLLSRQRDMGNSSWLQQWWNQDGYLRVRDPVVVNVSYFFGFVDDPTISVSPNNTNNGSSPNIQRAATMLFAAAEFRKLVVTGQLPYERVGKKKTPICATAYKYMFHACRIPRQHHDTYRIYDPARYSHCIVARKGSFFSIQLVDEETGDPLSVVELEEQLQHCIVMADEIPSSRPKLGLLTSQNRDDWAAAREQLVTTGGAAMEKALEILQSGALLVNLDDESPVSRQELGDLFWTGGLKSGGNRWFDKSIQIMVTNNGKAGLIAEHSMMDGMPVINFSDYMTKMTHAVAKRKLIVPTSRRGNVTDIFADALRPVDVNIVNRLEAQAWAHFHKLITDHVLHTQSFQAYGSSFIKKSGFPPDAFVQTAMQLATYRLFGEQVGTYEATQVRTFLHGRTEVTRAVTTASEAFVKKMGMRPKRDEYDPLILQQKISLLRNAATAHAKTTSLAAKAQGVDRHFLGLSYMVNQGESAPPLYSNPLFVRSKRWRSSTSQLSHPRFNIWGYGEVVPDGVGLAYAVNARSCVFNITALRSTGFTDKLSELLEEALLEMRTLAEHNKSTPATSKL